MVHLHRSGNLHSPLPRRFEKYFLPTDNMANSRTETSPSGGNQLIQEEIQRKMLIFIQVNHHPIGQRFRIGVAHTVVPSTYRPKKHKKNPTRMSKFCWEFIALLFQVPTDQKNTKKIPLKWAKFSDISYVLPIQYLLQNQDMITRTEADSILDLG